mgnify:CR=1 FL=1
MAEIQTWFTQTTGIEWRWLSFWSCAPKDLKTFALLEVSPSEYSTRKRAVMESIITSLIAPLFSSNGRRCVMMFCKSSCQIVVQNMYITALIFLSYVSKLYVPLFTYAVLPRINAICQEVSCQCQLWSNCTSSPPLAQQQSTDNKVRLMLG